MPLDHHISQVHLRKFYSPALGKRMYAIRKKDLRTFTPTSDAVCCIMDGSTNAYLRDKRMIEDFLKSIESNYNNALNQLIDGKIDNTCVYTIAGFIAYVMTCSPAGMRIQSGPLKSYVETTATEWGDQWSLPPSPAELSGANVPELLRNGAMESIINPKFPQAIGIASIVDHVLMFGNFKWEILHNDLDDNPFFTSNFPVAIEQTNDLRILNRIVPLAPNLALRIRPDLAVDCRRLPYSFANFRYRNRNLSHEEIVKLNRLIVRYAEDSVFYRDDYPWVRPFIAKNRHYRIEPHTHRPATPTGILLVSTHRIVSTAPPV